MKTGAKIALILVLAFLGIADSWYLAESAYSSTPLSCNIAGLDGCNTVAQSAYSHLLGIPLATYGVFFYGILFALALALIFTAYKNLYRALFWISLFGLIASIAFVLIQVLIIDALCIYCLISALFSLVAFSTARSLWKKACTPLPPVVLPWNTPNVLP